jgi:hypothetical protein
MTYWFLFTISPVDNRRVPAVNIAYQSFTAITVVLPNAIRHSTVDATRTITVLTNQGKTHNSALMHGSLVRAHSRSVRRVTIALLILQSTESAPSIVCHLPVPLAQDGKETYVEHTSFARISQTISTAAYLAISAKILLLIVQVELAH